MRKNHITLILLLISLVLAGCMGKSSVNNSPNVTNSPVGILNYDGLDYRQGEVLVKISSSGAAQESLTKMGSRIEKEWPQIGWALVSVPPGDNVLSFIKKLRKQKGVRFVEPNMTYELHQTPSLESYSKQWGFANINAEAGWDITTGDPNVIVAIIDSGVDKSHPEFVGKTFVGDYDATGQGLTGDDDGHGTHVAGIAAADGRTGKVAGVAWECPLMPIRVQEPFGGIRTSSLIDAMAYLGDYAKNNPQYRIIANMSLGGRGYNFAFKDAIDYAFGEGVLLITSTGNHSKRVINFPAAYNGVMSVAAVDGYDRRTSFSTSGFFVSVAAPGIRIYSTDLGRYEYREGTSMAAPFVTGAAALLLSKERNLTPLQIKNQIEQTARGDGFSEGLGYGVLDIKALLGPVKPMTYGSLKVTSNIVSSAEIENITGSGILTVFDSANNLVAFGTTGEDGGHNFWALKPGSYRVELMYYDRFIGDYQKLSRNVSVSSGGSSTTDFAVQMPIELNKEVVFTQQIDGPGASITIPLTITESGMYEISTSFYSTPCDTIISLYDQGGTLIDENDDFMDLYSLINVRLTPGDYSLVIEDWDGMHVACQVHVKKIVATY